MCSKLRKFLEKKLNEPKRLRKTMAVFVCLVQVVFIFLSGNNIGPFRVRDVKVIIIRICI